MQNSSRVRFSEAQKKSADTETWQIWPIVGCGGRHVNSHQTKGNENEIGYPDAVFWKQTELFEYSNPCISWYDNESRLETIITIQRVPILQTNLLQIISNSKIILPDMPLSQ